jgi:hypothetical protein
LTSIVSHSVSIHLRKTDGSYEKAPDLTISGQPATVVVGDFNGDDRKDLAVVYYDYTHEAIGNGKKIGVFRGNGDGTFVPEIPELLGVEWPYLVLSGDLNGDGYSDLIVNGSLLYPTQVFTPWSGLNLVGEAKPTSNGLRLTPSKIELAGAAWLQNKYDLTQGLDTTFQFQITGKGGISDNKANGGDGFAFILQNDSPIILGGTGVGLGYGGTHSNIVVEFDTWENGYFFFHKPDPNNNHISVHAIKSSFDIADEINSFASTTKIPNLSDGNIHTARVTYTEETLMVYLDDLSAPVLTVPIPFTSYLYSPKPSVWLGFAAGTGEAYEKHDILNWTINNGTSIIPPPETTLPGDLNADRIINLQDVIVSLQVSLGLVTPSDLQRAVGDLDRDDRLTIRDTTVILQKVVGR